LNDALSCVTDNSNTAVLLVAKRWPLHSFALRQYFAFGEQNAGVRLENSRQNLPGEACLPFAPYAAPLRRWPWECTPGATSSQENGT
jgi:hypothetical protein